MTARMRVAVIGVGTMGAMASWQLAERGADVTAYERLWVGHDEGAAGGGTRMFRRVYAEGAEYGPLIEASFGLWRRLERLTGTDLFFRTGGLSIGPADHPVIRGGLEDAASRGLPHELLDDAALADRYPQHRLLPGELALFDPEAGVLRSNAAIAAAAGHAVELGATLRTGITVDDVADSGDGVVVTAGGERERFDAAVIAGGPWAQLLLPELPLEVRAIFHTWHRVRNRQLLRPERHPITLRRSGELSSFATMSALDGQRVKFAPHFDYPRTHASVEDIDRSVKREWQERSADLIARLLPGVEPGPVESGVYPESFTPDGHPAIGHADAGGRITVLAGFSGHGFKLSPAFGRAAADLVIAGTTDLLPREVDLRRDFHSQPSIRDLALSSEPS